MSIIDFEKRPIVDLSALCQPIPGMPKDLCVTLPGGAQMCTQASLMHLGLFEYARLALGLANSALTPLAPFFRVVDVVVSIQKTLAVLPKVIGPPPRVKPLIDALLELAEKIKLVIQLMPIFSVPIMLVQMIDILIATLEGAASELKSLANYAEQIQRAQIGAADAEGLAAIIKCAKSSIDIEMSNIEHIFASINPTIDLLNLFASIAQIGKPFPLPHFGGAMPPEPDIAAESLMVIAGGLHKIRESIPI